MTRQKSAKLTWWPALASASYSRSVTELKTPATMPRQSCLRFRGLGFLRGQGFRFGLWGISVQCIQGTNKTEDQDTPSDATRQWWRLLPLHCCSQSLSRLHVLIAKILGLSFHHCSDRKFSHIHCQATPKVSAKANVDHTWQDPYKLYIATVLVIRIVIVPKPYTLVIIVATVTYPKPFVCEQLKPEILYAASEMGAFEEFLNQFSSIIAGITMKNSLPGGKYSCIFCQVDEEPWSPCRHQL